MASLSSFIVGAISLSLSSNPQTLQRFFLFKTATELATLSFKFPEDKHKERLAFVRRSVGGYRKECVLIEERKNKRKQLLGLVRIGSGYEYNLI